MRLWEVLGLSPKMVMDKKKKLYSIMYQIGSTNGNLSGYPFTGPDIF